MIDCWLTGKPPHFGTCFTRARYYILCRRHRRHHPRTNSYKLKVAATDRERYPGKYNGLLALGINYLYRYSTLIVFANYLLEMRIGHEAKAVQTFPKWLEQRREIRILMGKRSLD